LNGEYGQKGVYLGVPCKLGAKGLEQIVEVTLTPKEKAELEKSAAAVRETMQAVKL
jgi:malate dehydrogenase